MYTTDVVVAAAGRGKRVGATQNKLLLNLNQNSDRNEKAGEDKLFGKNVTTLLEYGLKTFQEHPGIRNIFLVVSKNDFQILQPWAEKEGFILVEGGERRQDSVHKALEHIHQHDELPDMVLIHDGARIFCTRDLIDRILDVCREYGSAIP
ncbi:MAG: 2-C-methyl-D-erythritol 4-phosphate cytidylyltransferase, partial [SAR324 cluster bacterium]|nr:2-C-methyl-D-erythritol 4-phosphate cytidylyltransferase [SAR324 cluster bacterium]